MKDALATNHELTYKASCGILATTSQQINNQKHKTASPFTVPFQLGHPMEALSNPISWCCYDKQLLRQVRSDGEVTASLWLSLFFTQTVLSIHLSLPPSYRMFLFLLAGVPSPRALWLLMRGIDSGTAHLPESKTAKPSSTTQETDHHIPTGDYYCSNAEVLLSQKKRGGKCCNGHETVCFTSQAM